MYLYVSLSVWVCASVGFTQQVGTNRELNMMLSLAGRSGQGEVRLRHPFPKLQHPVYSSLDTQERCPPSLAQRVCKYSFAFLTSIVSSSKSSSMHSSLSASTLLPHRQAHPVQAERSISSGRRTQARRVHTKTRLLNSAWPFVGPWYELVWTRAEVPAIPANTPYKWAKRSGQNLPRERLA